MTLAFSKCALSRLALFAALSLGTSQVCAAQVGTTGCTSNPNSTGSPATLVGFGSSSVSNNNLLLVAGPTPLGEPGKYVIADSSITPVMRSAGLYCLGPSGYYMNPAVYTGNGANANAMTLAVDVTAHGITAGDTRYFQLVYRDQSSIACTGSGNCYNTSSSLVVTFTP